jgi:hypothetical protein
MFRTLYRCPEPSHVTRTVPYMNPDAPILTILPHKAAHLKLSELPQR